MAVGIRPFNGGFGAEVAGFGFTRTGRDGEVAAHHRAFAGRQAIAVRGRLLESCHVVARDNAAVMHPATTGDLIPSKYHALWCTIITEGAAR